MPLYNQRTYNNQNNNDYQELGPILKYIVLAVIILILLIFFWWIMTPIGVVVGTYLMTKKF